MNAPITTPSTTTTTARSRSTDALDFTRPPADFIDVGHSQLAYRVLGSGPDVVLVHGWPLFSATWRDVAPLLARNFRVHLFDLPGCGHTRSAPDAPCGLRAHAETLRRAIAALGLDRYALVAHDSGAVITRWLAVDNPQVSAVVVADSEIPEHRSPLLTMLFAACATETSRKAMVMALRSRRLRRSIFGFGSCFHDRDRIDGDFHDLFVAPLLSDPDWLRGQMRLVDDFDWDEVDGLKRAHADIAAPVLLVWGEDDPYFPLAAAKEMLPQFPAAELVVLPKGRLFAHEEQADRFSEAVTAFVERSLAAG